jgi:hypothetical protein
MPGRTKGLDLGLPILRVERGAQCAASGSSLWILEIYGASVLPWGCFAHNGAAACSGRDALSGVANAPVPRAADRIDKIYHIHEIPPPE